MKLLVAKLGVSLLLLVGPLLGEGVAADLSRKSDFYVSADGSDDWSGLLPEPNAQRTDGPFASLARARQAVEGLKGRSATKDVVVLIRKGLYRLSQTVVFGPKDSPKAGSIVTYAAYPGEKPVFSSALEIKGWTKAPASLPGLPNKARRKVWMANVPKLNGAPWRFFTLYDAKGMLRRARSVGFTPTAAGRKDLLRFPENRLKNWPNLKDVEIVIRPHHAWIVNILPLASVNEKVGVARTSIPGTYPLSELKFMKGTKSCFVENVLEALDEPGEWVLNTREGRLYLWPRTDRAPQNIVAPRLRELVRVEGSIDKKGAKDTPVRNLHFRGLAFMHGERY